MSTRDKFVARMQAQLEDWRAELSKLESRAGAVRTDLRNKYQQAIQDLREKHSAAEARLGELKHAGEETWHELKEDLERIWTALKAELDAMREFSDHS